MKAVPTPWKSDGLLIRADHPRQRESAFAEVKVNGIDGQCALATARLIVRAVNAHEALVEALRMVELACANVGINLDTAFVWSEGDGSQSDGHGKRVYLTDTIRCALAEARGE